jgi:hypothetical protein
VGHLPSELDRKTFNSPKLSCYPRIQTPAGRKVLVIGGRVMYFVKNITAALEEGYKLERGICHHVCIGEMGENLEGVSHPFHVRQLHY